eukprot:TRINITY_DN334_c0_g1_i1.p2 TRINITY_DN334_c0_g1~~TRINITY_DN334_c0_g1_i1.p2  ORF type:complete len:622 (+),score=126.32 TRINITY_DN334_c0_g1_i1:1223-3088(+)
MPKKKEGGGKKDDKTSKKTQKKQQEKVIEDKTFGLKNKNKSTKVQKFVKSVAQQVKGVVGKGGEQAQREKEYKEKMEKKKQQEKEQLINSLFNSVSSVKQQQPKEGEDSKSIICAFFKAGICKKGDKCKFSHDLGIEKRAAKADLYTDMRTINTGDNMANWDQAYLEQVINEKNNKRGAAPSNIVCKHFLDAVENRTYGWFWECPNGETCQYRHCLPPGYVLKRDKEKTKDLEKMEEQKIEEIIDAERDELLRRTNLTKVTLQTLNAWKLRKQQERDKKAAEEMKRESKKGGGKMHNMLSGRALFKFDPTAFKDDEDAMEEYKEEQEMESEQTATDTSKEEHKQPRYKDWNTLAEEERNIQQMIENARRAALERQDSGSVKGEEKDASEESKMNERKEEEEKEPHKDSENDAPKEENNNEEEKKGEQLALLSTSTLNRYYNLSSNYSYIQHYTSNTILIIIRYAYKVSEEDIDQNCIQERIAKIFFLNMSQDHQLLRLHSSAEMCKEGTRKTSDAPTDSSNNEIAPSQFFCPEEQKTHALNLPLSVSTIELASVEKSSKTASQEASPVSPKKKMGLSEFGLLELVGMGAYSKVALVEQIATGRKFAMKVMEKKFLLKVAFK